MQHFRPHLADLGLTEQQWRVLRVLGEDGQLEAGVVAQRACILPPSLSRILKTLSADGLIRSGADSRDGRRTLLSLSDEGRSLLSRAAPTSAAIYRRLEEAVGPEEWEALLDTLARLQASVSAAKNDEVPPSRS
jgi:homoprotocatechuate degradation regulator HpaR